MPGHSYGRSVPGVLGSYPGLPSSEKRERPRGPTKATVLCEGGHLSFHMSLGERATKS